MASEPPGFGDLLGLLQSQEGPLASVSTDLPIAHTFATSQSDWSTSNPTPRPPSGWPWISDRASEGLTRDRGACQIGFAAELR